MNTWTRADGARVSSTPEDVSMFFEKDPIFGNGAFDASGDEKATFSRHVDFRPPKANIGQKIVSTLLLFAPPSSLIGPLSYKD